MFVTNLCNKIRMKFQKILPLFLCLGLSFSGCNKTKENEPEPSKQAEPEEYINPFEPEETVPGDEGGEEVTPDPVDPVNPVIPEPVYDEENAWGNPYYLGRNGEDDLAGTYVEVNLSAQYLWFYKDGEVFLETDIVSGDISKGRSTKTGVFPLA